MAKRPASKTHKKPARTKGGDRLVKLSIAAGDPLQPAGLPLAENPARAARAAALKSAHARFKDRAKPPK